ncbi:hypothetical protein N7532_003331 [Penicillium argentinense]|uniref:Uncharacterized protein n=1 Tax=Penicillium argentinense TaxID=1131581 RepID=A0A9W9FMP3_9EURO|nr:uncharacterized protein N7532_003331 [Penicillium argentinense]KAJ5102802.1 hypothetical protein N7532_003331 [Penicillium argentinense]
MMSWIPGSPSKLLTYFVPNREKLFRMLTNLETHSTDEWERRFEDLKSDLMVLSTEAVRLTTEVQSLRGVNAELKNLGSG